MGLIDLQTDLKSLKYSTVPGNGTGPYIQKDINQDRGNSKYTFTDFPSPGGGLFASKIAEDVERIGKWFDDGANRAMWAIKQTTLQAFNQPDPATEYTPGPIANIPDVLGANVLANIAASPLGIHLYNRGIAGFIPQDQLYAERKGGVFYSDSDKDGYGMANSGKKSSFFSDKTKQDRINLLPIKTVQGGENEDILQKDLIKFGFRVINNNDPSSVELLQFRAYLTNISDNFNPSWDSVKYIGRGEEFYNYTGFSRNVSFNLAFAALSREELIPLYEKITYLASLTAPDYTDNGYMRGNIVKLTIGDYIANQPGVIDSLSYSLEDGVWDIEDGRQFTHVLKAQISMKLIHKGLPRKGYGFIGTNSNIRPTELPIEVQTRKLQPVDKLPSDIRGTRPPDIGQPQNALPSVDAQLPTFNTNVPLGSEGTPSSPLINIP